jgi:FemAB-related protein (PEP-CTERM system-associated)
MAASVPNPIQATSTLRVEKLSEADAPAWDRFVSSHIHGSPFHLTAWKRTIEESYPYRPFYLLAADDCIRGVLPLFFVANRAVGKALISSPFAVYGGILADSPEVRDRLYEEVRRLGRELGVDYIELRNAFPEQCAGKPNVDRYVTFGQALQPGEEALIESLPKKTRNMVRKALKTPFEARYGVRDSDRFDAIMARNMRRLGTPTFPRKYYDRLLANFGEMADIREVWLDGRLMAASLNFYFRGEMHTYHAAADTRFNQLGPNTFMYFDHLRWAGDAGFRLFDFGRSKRGTGVFEFKRHWNTEMRPLPYEIVLINRKELPNFSPANPKFQLAIRVWRKLPLWLTRVLGPRLIKLFP